MKSFQDYKTKQGIGAVRLRLGLSQEIFAMELGISRSLLSKAENKTRSLPTCALVKLSALEISLASKAEGDGQPEPRPEEIAEHYTNDYAPSMLQLQQRSYTARAERLQFQLDMMVVRYKQVRFTLDQLDKMIEENKLNGRFFPGILEANRYSALRKLNSCSQLAQSSLRNKIALYHAAATLHATTVRISGVDTMDDLK